MAGFPKDNYYYHQSVFFTPEERPILHLVPMHWNFKEGTIVRVWAYTNADSVEILLNGRSLGRKDKNASCRHVEWEVTHSAGELTARAYRQGQGSYEIFASESVVTAGPPVALVLETDWPLTKELKADNSDTALITVRVVDSNGNTVKTESPDSSTKITYTLSGEGKFIGKGNGDPSNHEHDQPESPTSAIHSIWNGLARLLVQSTRTPGTITITAHGTALETGTVSFVTKALENSIIVVV
jgi:beta-galactosidase